MESKKNPKLELHRYSMLFFSIGLTISLSAIILIFEWRTTAIRSSVDLVSSGQLFEEVLYDIPITRQGKPMPIIQQPQVISVPDDEEIVENIEFDLDIEIVEESVIEEIASTDELEEEVTDEVFTVTEEMPVFPGGSSEFYKFVSNNLNYPRKAIKAEVEGKVIVRFVVGKQGNISEVEVLKGIGYDCDEEAVRIIQASPNWLPGKHNGKSVKVRMIVPLNFQLS